jgi:hypothetical protein
MSDTMTQESWAAQFLTDLGDNPSQNAEIAVEVWESGEGGAGPQWDPSGNNIASFNPINTTLKEPGSVDTPGNNPPVQAYTSWEQGLDASVATLEESHPGYAAIRNDLATGASVSQTNADIDASKWGTHDLPTTSVSVPDPSTGETTGGEPLVGQAQSAVSSAGSALSNPGGTVLSLLGLSSTGNDIAKVGVLLVGVVVGGGLILVGAYKAISGTKAGQDLQSAAKTGALAAAA